MLGIFFGCSFLSIFEIFHFLADKILKLKSSLKRSSVKTEDTDFVKESTFHGIKFIFDTNYKDIVRIFWFLIFLCSSYVCIINTHGNYLQWRVNPDKDKAIVFRPSIEVSFPAITICSKIFAKHRLANYLKFSDYLRKVDASTEETKFMIANLHRFSVPPTMIDTIKMEKKFSQEFDIVDYLNKSQYSIEELFFDCKLGEKGIDCSKIFKRVLTHHGICFAFNQEGFHTIFNDRISHDFDFYGRGIQTVSQWTLDKGYLTKDVKTYPYRMDKANEISFGLKILEDDASNVYQSQKQFVVYLNKPNEILSVFAKPFNVEFKQDLALTFAARLTTYDKEFRRFSPKERDCFFTDEYKLKYFKSYTFSNCVEECFAEVILILCNCTKFSMARDDRTPVCIINSTLCYFQQMNYFTTSQKPCGCFKTCNDLTYSIVKEEKMLEKRQYELRNK